MPDTSQLHKDEVMMCRVLARGHNVLVAHHDGERRKFEEMKMTTKGGGIVTFLVWAVGIILVLAAFAWLFGWGPWSPTRQQAAAIEIEAERPVGMRTSVPSQNTFANSGPKFRAFQDKNCVGADFAGMDINPETGKRGYHCVTPSTETVREVWD